MASPSGTHTAFFYGTLMAPSVLRRVTQHKAYPARKDFLVRTAILHGHRRHRVKGADYPAVLKVDEGKNEGGATGEGVDETGSGGEGAGRSSVVGTVVSNLSDDDMWRLDKFEGDEYERVHVRVRVISSMDPEHDSGDKSKSEESRTVSKVGEDAATQGEEVEAQVYVWIASRDELEDEEWDFDEFVREKLGRWAGIDSEEFRELDEAVREAKMNGYAGGQANGSGTSKASNDTGEFGGATFSGGDADPTRGRSFAGGEFERMVEAEEEGGGGM